MSSEISKRPAAQLEGGQSGECTENDQNTVSLPAVDKNAAH